jgi:hypothetical protein
MAGLIPAAVAPNVRSLIFTRLAVDMGVCPFPGIETKTTAEDRSVAVNSLP